MQSRNFRPKDHTQPFASMLQSMTRSATGISNQKSHSNMTMAKSNENILSRLQSLADLGLNTKKPAASPLDRYLSKYRYINRYIRTPQI